MEQQPQLKQDENPEEINQSEEEQQTKLTANQLKRQKQKQKKALQKQEQAKQEQEQQKEEQTSESNDGSEVDSFEEELQWCIKQLKLGLERNQLDKEQISESNKVIIKLESDKVTYVAKRHLMRVIFGDYRKLMKTMK